jgi:hypothetical protein
MSNLSRVIALDDYRGDECAQRPLIEPGDYDVVYERHAGVTMFERATKVRVYFRLLAHPGITLERWYPVQSYKGRISAPAHSDIVRELSVVLNQRVRHDRIPVASLANHVIVAEVKTVTHDRRQRALDPINQYSVISRLKGKA